MSHSVSGHLALQVADYDKLIRCLVPAYDRMREVQLAALEIAIGEARSPGALVPPAVRANAPGGRAPPPGLVLDLGGGTGALAEAIAERFATVRVEIWDTDPAMLEIAAGRCARWGSRVAGVARSFTDPLPPCDAVAAAIALHHVKDLTVKAGIYRNIYAALRPGGIFVNADTAVASSGPVQEFAYVQWIADMGRHGITEPEARAHFAAWSREDYYPPVVKELDLLRAAGFAEPEVFWREGAAIVFGAVK
jgi:tRNA (cmo5U34)-methyltransferase